MISLHNATIKLDDLVILKDCNFVLNEGDKAFIKGSSGSGKASFVKALMGTKKLSAGKLLLLGNDMNNLKQSKLNKLRKQMGFVLRDPLTVEESTVRSFLLLCIKATTKLKKAKADLLIINSLSQLDLLDTIDKNINNLSFSERKRLDFARAIMNEPKIVVAIDPFDSIDETNADIILKVLNDLNAKGTIILVLSSSNKKQSMADYTSYNFEEKNIMKVDQLELLS